MVGYKRVGGPEGTKKVPDLATAIPEPTDNGKTWKFTLRSGIKFSNGTPLTGRDVKATFERLFKIGNSPNAGSWYNVIVGGDACVKTPKTCDLSQGVVVNGNTVTFHLTRGDPEFLDKLSVPFAYILPAATPAKNLNIPPAGTGPYKWVQYAPQTQMKIVRNPYFKEWSKDAQPDGLPDSIVQKFGLSVEAEVTQVENGQADGSRTPIRSRPTGSPSSAPSTRARCTSTADCGVLLRVQHAGAALQQPEGATGGELRDRPQRPRQALRRHECGSPHVKFCRRTSRATSRTARARSLAAAAGGPARTWRRLSSSSPSQDQGAAVKVNSDTTEVDRHMACTSSGC